MYLDGKDVKKDLSKAKYWIGKAKNNSSEDAKDLWLAHKLWTY